LSVRTHRDYFQARAPLSARRCLRGAVRTERARWCLSPRAAWRQSRHAHNRCRRFESVSMSVANASGLTNVVCRPLWALSFVKSVISALNMGILSISEIKIRCVASFTLFTLRPEFRCIMLPDDIIYRNPSARINWEWNSKN
jgi:hypothetical protein